MVLPEGEKHIGALEFLVLESVYRKKYPSNFTVYTRCVTAAY